MGEERIVPGKSSQGIEIVSSSLSKGVIETKHYS